jgi:hypothetical protein
MLHRAMTIPIGRSRQILQENESHYNGEVSLLEDVRCLFHGNVWSEPNRKVSCCHGVWLLESRMASQVRSDIACFRDPAHHIRGTPSQTLYYQYPRWKQEIAIYTAYGIIDNNGWVGNHNGVACSARGRKVTWGEGGMSDATTS